MGEISLFRIWVDGTLANSYVVAGVAAWSVILSALAAWGVGTRRSRRVQALGVVVFVVGAWLTAPAQRQLTHLAYVLVDPSITGIDFFGEPPSWIAPATAVGVGALVRLARIRR